MELKVGISNRHVHLTKEVYIKLFGNENLEKAKDLTQYGEFASTSFVDIKTEKSIIKNVRILGPFRKYNQVEISKTDAYTLGLNPPVRNSGDLFNSESVTLVGPNGEVELIDSCILATRHIHIHENDLEKMNLTNNEVVSVRVNTEKGGIMDSVYVKAGNYYFELHIDTDDANAHLLKNGDIVEIIK